jgi:hypothetical protein
VNVINGRNDAAIHTGDRLSETPRNRCRGPANASSRRIHQVGDRSEHVLQNHQIVPSARQRRRPNLIRPNGCRIRVLTLTILAATRGLTTMGELRADRYRRAKRLPTDGRR